MGRGNGRTQSTRAAATRRGGPNTNPPPRWHGFSGHVSVRPGGAIARFLEKGPERQDNDSSADTPSRHQEQKMSSDASPTPRYYGLSGNLGVRPDGVIAKMLDAAGPATAASSASKPPAENKKT